MYTKVLVKMPEKAKIVAAADINPEKLRGMRGLTGIPESACYASAEEMLEKLGVSEGFEAITPEMAGSTIANIKKVRELAGL